MSSPRILDIAWLAGLLEGEGAFLFQKCKNWKGSLKIALQMSDYDIVARVANMFDRPCLGPYGPYNGSLQVKQTWQTYTTGSEAAAWMMTLYNFLGNRRREKIKELLLEWQKQQIQLAGRSAKCHELRAYWAKDLCRPCYDKFHREVHENE